MFPSRFFCDRFFAGRFWPKVGEDSTVEPQTITLYARNDDTLTLVARNDDSLTLSASSG